MRERESWGTELGGHSPQLMMGKEMYSVTGLPVDMRSIIIITVSV